jgi:hypothetical protein
MLTKAAVALPLRLIIKLVAGWLLGKVADFPEHDSFEDVFGSINDLATKKKTGLSIRHAMLVRVEYNLSGERGWLIVLKPTLIVRDGERQDHRFLG